MKFKLKKDLTMDTMFIEFETFSKNIEIEIYEQDKIDLLKKYNDFLISSDNFNIEKEKIEEEKVLKKDKIEKNIKLTEKVTTNNNVIKDFIVEKDEE